MSLQNDSICCEQFDPDKFQEKTHIWQDKLFLKDEVVQFMHIPINMGQVVNRMFKKIQEVGAVPINEDFLMLCYDPSPWKSEIYMTVTKTIPNGEMARLSGTFLSKVYDGPYNAVLNWIKDMDEYAKESGQSVQKY